MSEELRLDLSCVACGALTRFNPYAVVRWPYCCSVCGRKAWRIDGITRGAAPDAAQEREAVQNHTDQLKDIWKELQEHTDRQNELAALVDRLATKEAERGLEAMGFERAEGKGAEAIGYCVRRRSDGDIMLENGLKLFPSPEAARQDAKRCTGSSWEKGYQVCEVRPIESRKQ